MADVKKPTTRQPQDEHTKRCYWDLHECRWVCDHGTEPVPDDQSAHRRDRQ